MNAYVRIRGNFNTLDDETTKKTKRWTVRRVNFAQLEDTLNELAAIYSEVEYWNVSSKHDDLFQVTAHNPFDEEDGDYDDEGEYPDNIFNGCMPKMSNAKAVLDIAWCGI